MSAWGTSDGVWKRHKPVTAEQTRDVVSKCRKEKEDPHRCFLGGDLESYPVCDKGTCDTSKYGERAANVHAQIRCARKGEVGDRARRVLNALGKKCKRAAKSNDRAKSPRRRRSGVKRKRSRSPKSR